MATTKSKNSDSLLERLLELMNREGLSKAQLARDLAVSNAHVANWLSGQMPRAEHLLTISRRFGVTMEWLLTGDDTSGQQVQPAAPRLKEAKVAAERLALQLGQAEETARALRNYLGL